jgi:phage/plasmid-like protein (TIGR03299 family)
MHEITKSDKVLAVREATWHGLEELLPEYPTREQAESLVHDWSVIREPLYRKKFSVDEQGPHEEFELIEEFQLNTRSDTGAELSVVPSERIDIQPHEMWDMAELIQGNDKNVQYETAGSLRGGRDVWILIRLNEPVVINGDPQGESLPYFALQNGYEPGVAFRGQATNVRIVCKNTSRLSDLVAEAKGVNFSFRHGATLRERIEEIQDALAAWRESVQAWKAQKEFMLTQRVNARQANWFVEQFIEMPHVSLTTDRVKQNVELARLELVTELYGGMNVGITHTALGLFEAASSWNEHVRAAQTPITRFKRSVLSPTDILEHAHHLALEAVNI